LILIECVVVVVVVVVVVGAAVGVEPCEQAPSTNAKAASQRILIAVFPELNARRPGIRRRR
jgi:hypothetical protein